MEAGPHGEAGERARSRAAEEPKIEHARAPIRPLSTAERAVRTLERAPKLATHRSASVRRIIENH